MVGFMEFEPSPDVRGLTKRLREQIEFSSENLASPQNSYVSWIDIMGAGHLMSTSPQKAANAIVRLHLAVERIARESNFQGLRLAINDGIYIVSDTKATAMNILRGALTLLAGNFVAIVRPQDRFLVRAGLAYGPVYTGPDLLAQFGARRREANTAAIQTVLFGPAIIQAYRSKSAAPPYGVAVHESARSFAPIGEDPFRMTHWRWWYNNDDGSEPRNAPAQLRSALGFELEKHFNWLIDTEIFHAIDSKYVENMRKSSRDYFFGSGADRPRSDHKSSERSVSS